MKNLISLIADSIKEADKSYFAEDYVEQAQAVLYSLKKNKLVIMPRDLTDELIKKVVLDIPYGNTKPEDLIKEIYQSIVKNAKN